MTDYLTRAWLTPPEHRFSQTRSAWRGACFGISIAVIGTVERRFSAAPKSFIFVITNRLQPVRDLLFEAFGEL